MCMGALKFRTREAAPRSEYTPGLLVVRSRERGGGRASREDGGPNFQRLVTKKPCKTGARAWLDRDRVAKKKEKKKYAGARPRWARYQTFKKCGHICNFLRKVTL